MSGIRAKLDAAFFVDKHFVIAVIAIRSFRMTIGKNRKDLVDK